MGLFIITELFSLCVLFQIYCEVVPKRLALSQANAELEMATAKLLAVQKKLAVSAKILLLLTLSHLA